MRDNAGLFGLPQSLIDAVKNVQEGSAEYQNKVKAHMAKKGIKSLSDLSPEEKKKFFNDLDAMHKAKNEEVEIEESDLPSSKEKQKTVMVVHKTSGKELKIQASALDKYKAMGYKLMEEAKKEEKCDDCEKPMSKCECDDEEETVDEAESHQSKTTMKHISKPTAGEKKAAKDIKPGIAGYRDRIAMLKSAKARGALKEDGTEIEEADDKKKAMASRIAAKLNSKASKMNADKAKTLDAMKRGQGEKGKNYLLSKNEEVEIEEAKSGTGYQLYHKDFSSAMAHAYDFAKQKYNIEIDPMEIDRNVAMGPKKPSSGKSNAYRLLDKTGKKAIQVQVANLDNKRYELNMYKEEVETIDERNKENADKRKAMDASRGSNFKAQGHYTPAPGPEHKTDQAHSKSVGRAIRKMSREEVEVEEARVKGKGYDNPENERKAPEGKVPFTSFQQGKQGDQAARLHATSAKGKFVKGKAQSAPQKEPQKESYELTPEDIEFINSLNEKQ